MLRKAKWQRKKINGFLETGINYHQNDNHCLQMKLFVSKEIHLVDQREEKEWGDLSLGVIGKSNKDKLDDCAWIFLSHIEWSINLMMWKWEEMFLEDIGLWWTIKIIIRLFLIYINKLILLKSTSRVTAK